LTKKALAGLKIIELSQGVAGPYLGKLFAEFGAEVIKLEPPGQGDEARLLPPLADGVPALEGSGIFAYLNTNKKSATLDLWTEKGALFVRRLCHDADIVIEGCRPGALDEVGLGLVHLQRENPDIILTSVTWFGQYGPYRDFKGNDPLCHALSGVTYHVGPKEGPPVLFGGYQAQFVGGITAFVATMGALIGQTNGHNGQHVDVSIMEANLCFSETGAASFASTGETRTRQGINRFIPTYPACAFPCRGGWIGVTALTPFQWEGLCDMIGIPELKHNPHYATSILRAEHADELEPVLAARFLERTAEEWFHLAQSKRIPFALVPTMAELLSSPHFKERGAFIPITHPDLGTFDAPAVPFKLMKTPALKGGASPRLGQHNREVYQGHLGISDSEMAQLKDEGVI
jgi:crotonobetainyl-CoA:carnitine CoA-transferase CaiB-like acyl-CoA transferase